MTVFNIITNYLQSKNLPFERKDLTKEQVGSTGYIDQFKAKTFPKGALYGVDPSGRAYVAIKASLKHVNEADREYDRDIVYVAFQRYTDNPTLWVSTSPYAASYLQTVLAAWDQSLFSGKTLTADSYVHGDYHVEF